MRSKDLVNLSRSSYALSSERQNPAHLMDALCTVCSRKPLGLPATSWEEYDTTPAQESQASAGIAPHKTPEAPALIQFLVTVTHV